MTSAYTHLLRPGKIGTLWAENRVIMAPVCTNFALESGGVSQSQINYYSERAKGGVGLIVVENANIDYPVGRNGATQLRIDDDAFIPGLARLVEAIHEARTGVKAAIQLNHAGATTKSSRIGGLRPVAPSEIPVSPSGEIPRALTEEELERIAEKFAMGALRAKKAGFDAVEIHGGYAYLLGEFISPLTNQRNDNFGGTVENRFRFPALVVRKIRETVGPTYPVLFRMNGDEFMPGALTAEEAVKGAQILESAGVDLLHVTAGNGFTVERHIEPGSFPEGWKTYLARNIKSKVSIPVAAVGVIRNPSAADAVIKNGDADFVAMGRGLIADPYWVNKAKAGEAESIRRCISCNVCASRRIFEDLPIRCTVNPEAGHEGEHIEPLTVAKQSLKVAVIGGGPGGMYTAALLSKSGHRVKLFETNDFLGGQLALAAVPPHKEKINWLFDYLQYELKNSNVEIKLGVMAEDETLLESGAEIIILATGAEPLLPKIPGASGSSVITAHELLGKKTIIVNSNVVVIGGGSVGCECAEYLAGSNKVTVLEMMPNVVGDLNLISRKDLLSRIEKAAIEIKTNTKVTAIEHAGVACESKQPDGTVISQVIPAEWVILAVGAKPKQELALELKEAGREVMEIGDCIRPGRIGDVLRQSVLTVRKINQLI